MFFKLIVVLITTLTSINLFSEEQTVNNINSCDCEDEDRISKHNDLYFITGQPNTKVQISLKYKLFSRADLFIAYTQTMFWNIKEESSPFKDVNYNPELFYRINTRDSGILKSIDIGIYEHKSNGRSGSESRAWSRSYIKFNTTSEFNKWTFNWDTKVFALYKFSLDKTNMDIGEYMGFWETKVSLVNFFNLTEFVDRATLYFAFFSGGKISESISKGGQELGFKLRLGGWRFNPSLFIQLYHGYNESLLEYNKEFWSYRLGLSF